MTGRHVSGDSNIGAPSSDTVGHKLAGIPFGMKPGGMVFGSWPGGCGSPLNHPSKTAPQDIAGRSHSSTGKSSDEILSISPKIDTEGNAIGPAEKKRFRTSQEFKVDRGIESAVLPLNSQPALKASMQKINSLKRKSSGGMSISPTSRRSSSNHPISLLTKRKSSGNSAIPLLQKILSQKSIPNLIEQLRDDGDDDVDDDDEEVKVRSALEDSVSSLKEVQDYFGDLSRYKRPSDDTLSSVSPRTSNAKQTKISSIPAADRLSIDGLVSIDSPLERSKREELVKFDLTIKEVDTPKEDRAEGLPKRLNMPSFVDLLDTAIGNYDPHENAGDGRVTPPPGILNAPYCMNGSLDPPDHHDPNYDTDWSDRLSNPAPGSGVYIGELIEQIKTPKNRNVVYISLDSDGEALVKALPYNRRGQKIALRKLGELEKGDIELRGGFGKHWMKAGEDEEILHKWMKLAKDRLEGKKELDKMREMRFADDVKAFWKLRS